MQRQELLADKNIDMRPVRVRTGRMFLDGFAAIRAQEADLDLPIFAAMSPTDQVRRSPFCLPSRASIRGSERPEPRLAPVLLANLKRNICRMSPIG